MIEAENIPLLFGNSTLEEWEGELNLKTKVLKVNIDGNKEIKYHESRGGHVVIPLYPDFTTEETVFLMNKEVDLEDEKKIRKIHESTNHKSENNMLHAYRNAGKLTDTVRKSIKKVIETCDVCKKYKKSQGKPKVSLTKVTDFNQIVTMDLKQFKWSKCVMAY